MPEEDRAIVLALIGVHVLLLVVAILGVPWPDLLLAVGISTTTVAASVVFVDRVRARGEARRLAPAKRAAYEQLAQTHNEICELWKSFLRDAKRTDPQAFDPVPAPEAVWMRETAQKFRVLEPKLWQSYVETRRTQIHQDLINALSTYGGILPPALVEVIQDMLHPRSLWCLDVGFLRSLPPVHHPVPAKPAERLDDFAATYKNFYEQLEILRDEISVLAVGSLEPTRLSDAEYIVEGL